MTGSNRTIGADAGGGQDAILQRLTALETRVRELAATRTLAAASIDTGGLDVQGGGAITVSGGGGLSIGDGGDITIGDGGDITIDGGDLVVDGGTASSGGFAHGSAGWRLSDNGNAEFNDITLRGGIIGDDALANPIHVACKSHDDSLASLSITPAVGSTVSFTVPDGFSKAAIVANAIIAAIPGSTTDSLLIGGIGINGDYDPEVSGITDEWNNSGGAKIGPCQVYPSRADFLTGLGSGDTIDVQACAAEGFSGDFDDGAFYVLISALVLFLR